MNKIGILLSTSVLILITGCAGPKITGSKIPSSLLSRNPEILLINDNETRDGFNDAVEGWLKDKGKRYTVKPEYAKHDPSKITIEYVGYWGWDLAMYLERSEIDAFYNGQRVGSVSFKAPNSLNLNKWGNAEQRIRLMLDVLFGEKTAQAASRNL